MQSTLPQVHTCWGCSIALLCRIWDAARQLCVERGKAMKVQCIDVLLSHTRLFLSTHCVHRYGGRCRQLKWDPLCCNCGIIGIYKDPDIVTSIPYSHYYWVGVPPKPYSYLITETSIQQQTPSPSTHPKKKC